MNWQEVCESPYLKDIPFKVELSGSEQIVMSPAKNFHAVFQGEIICKLKELTGNTGKTFPECSIQTEDNVKVADVVWFSLKRYQQVKHEIAYSIAPEICIEVISPSNTKKEMLEKMRLYLKSGAQEMWTCDESGKISFYNQEGNIPQSLLITEFPKNTGVE